MPTQKLADIGGGNRLATEELLRVPILFFHVSKLFLGVNKGLWNSPTPQKHFPIPGYSDFWKQVDSLFPFAYLVTSSLEANY